MRKGICIFYALVCCVAACLIVLIMYSRIVNVGNKQLSIWLYSASNSLLGLVRCAVTVMGSELNYLQCELSASDVSCNFIGDRTCALHGCLYSSGAASCTCWLLSS